MKLYEIADEMVNLLDQVDPDTGELPEQLLEVTQDFKSKSASIVAYCLNLDAVIEKRKELLKKVQAQVKAEENKIKSIKEYLAFQMERTGISKIEANDLSFVARLHLGRDSSVEVYDEKQLPESMLRIIPEKKEADKKLIREQILAGNEVPGARIVKKNRLEIK